MAESIPCPSDDDIIDRAAILDRFEGDVELIQEVAALFVEDCPRRVGTMRDALQRCDLQALQSVAHSLRGSVGNFAAAAAFAAAQHLEEFALANNLVEVEKACGDLERELARLLPVLERVAAVSGDQACTDDC
jgi:two-component system sensor histidine kinase/response regulator